MLSALMRIVCMCWSSALLVVIHCSLTHAPAAHDLQLQQPPHQPSVSTQRPTSSVPPLVQHQHQPVAHTCELTVGISQSLLALQHSHLALHQILPSVQCAMNSAAADAWLRRQDLADLLPKLQSRWQLQMVACTCMPIDAYLQWMVQKKSNINQL